MSNKRVISITLLLLTALFIWIVFRVWQFNSARNDILHNMAKIDKIALAQQEQFLSVEVFINGPNEGLYLLNVDIAADGYMQEKLLKLSQEVPVNFSKQSFLFNIPFQEMADAYRKKIDSYISVENKRLMFEEYINITASLMPVKFNQYSKTDIEKMQIEPDWKYAIAQFYFACYQKNCNIYQKNTDGKPSHQLQSQTK